MNFDDFIGSVFNTAVSSLSFGVIPAVDALDPTGDPTLASMRLAAQQPPTSEYYDVDQGSVGHYETQWISSWDDPGGVPVQVWVPYVAPPPVEEVEPMWEDIFGANGGGYIGDFELGDIEATAGYDWSDYITPDVIEAGMGMIPAGVSRVAAGAAGGVIAGAQRTLASLLGRAGGAVGRFNINGVTGTMSQLWKYVRRMGPGPVATALGISVGALGAMLLEFPDRPRRRRRGISGRDIRTTKRVVNFVSRMANQIGCVRAPRHFTARRTKHSHTLN